jgi:hypothetical protein
MAQTHSGETVTVPVTAFFFHSKFSHKNLPGATHEDMAEIHDQQREHHLNQAKKLQRSFMRSNNRADRGRLKKQMKNHAKLAARHQKMVEHFHSTDPNNMPDHPTHTKIAQPSAPHTMSQHTGGNSPVPGHVPTPNHMKNGGGAPHSNAPAQPHHGMGHVITHGAAKLWHSLAPHVKHWFTKKRPNSPMSQSHNTGHPTMPMPPEDVAKGHNDQAEFHNQQAQAAQKQVAKAPNPARRAAAAKNVAMHTAAAKQQATLGKKIGMAAKGAPAPKIKPPIQAGPKPIVPGKKLPNLPKATKPPKPIQPKTVTPPPKMKTPKPSPAAAGQKVGVPNVKKPRIKPINPAKV